MIFFLVIDRKLHENKYTAKINANPRKHISLF